MACNVAGFYQPSLYWSNIVRYLPLDHGIDYRRLQRHPMRFCLHQPTRDHDNSNWLPAAGSALLHRALRQISELTLLAKIDTLFIWRNKLIIGFDFMALCAGPRSQLDYMALASRLPGPIAVANVPQFTSISDTAILHGMEENYQREHKDIFVSKLDNEARRFIALVDECYDRRCLLLLTAQVPVAELYQASQLSFAFERTVSRLYEMQSWHLDAMSA